MSRGSPEEDRTGYNGSAGTGVGHMTGTLMAFLHRVLLALIQLRSFLATSKRTSIWPYSEYSALVRDCRISKGNWVSLEN